MKTLTDNPYNPYNFEANYKFSQNLNSSIFTPFSKQSYFSTFFRVVLRSVLLSFALGTKGGDFKMISYKVGRDLATLKKNFQTYKPVIAPMSLKMFWISIAITLSFIISQIYIMLSR